MAHTFEIVLYDTVTNIIDRVKTELVKAGGKFSGDRSSGSFSGSGVEGVYHVVGQLATVTINKKPFIASMSYIESRIRAYFK